MKEKNLYYHYCKVDTFKEIISSKVLWLSDLTKSNDKEEVSRTFRVLWNSIKPRLLESDLEAENVKKLIELLDRQYDLELQIDSPFGICFCRSGDVLQQWLEYGDKTRGIVLGFDLEWFENLRRQKPHPNVEQSFEIGFDSTIYQDKLFEDIMFNICYSLIKKYGPSAWILGIRPKFKHYSAFIKNPTFYGEQEERIVYYPATLKPHKENNLKISELIETPFPHYCLPWTKGDGYNALKAIGLGCNCDITQEDIKKMMIATDQSGDFEIFNSECSYRIR